VPPAAEAVERVDRERSIVSHSQADRRGAAQWNHRRGRGRQPRRGTQPLPEGNQGGELAHAEPAKKLLTIPDRSKIKGKRDYVILALLLGVRTEAAGAGQLGH